MTRTLATLLVLAAFPLAANAQNPPPALRARFGASVGVMYFGGTATFDYSPAPTPFAGATGPYTGAVLAADHVGPGFLLSGGFRGPIRKGSKLGLGIDFHWGGGGGHPPDKQVTGTSPTGALVTFSTEHGGIVDMVLLGGGGHISYNVVRRVNVMGGVNVTSVRVKPGFGSYIGPASQPGFTNYLANQGDKSPIFWRRAAAPWVGAEVFLSNHASLDVSASFPPAKTEHLADTPWILTFQRHHVWFVMALRIFG